MLLVIAIVMLLLQPVVLVLFGLDQAAIWSVFVIGYGTGVLALRVRRDLSANVSVHLEAAALTCVLMGGVIFLGWFASDTGTTWIVALPALLLPMVAIAYSYGTRRFRRR